MLNETIKNRLTCIIVEDINILVHKKLIISQVESAGWLPTNKDILVKYINKRICKMYVRLFDPCYLANRQMMLF